VRWVQPKLVTECVQVSNKRNFAASSRSFSMLRESIFQSVEGHSSSPVRYKNQALSA
jgi:hypothetical protein